MSRVYFAGHSKDGNLSILLQERVINCTNGQKWDKLVGRVSTFSQEFKSILVQVECLFLYKSPLGIRQERVMFKRGVLLKRRNCEIVENGDVENRGDTEITPETNIETTAASGNSGNNGNAQGDTVVSDVGNTPQIQSANTYEFQFDFGQKTLPPSFWFDPEDWGSLKPFGVCWNVVAYLSDARLQVVGQYLDEVKTWSRASCPFQVSYIYTEELTALQPDWGTPILGQNSSFLLFKPTTTFSVQILNPVYSLGNITVNVTLGNTTLNTVIQHVKVTLVQNLTISFPASRQHLSKQKSRKTCVLFDRQPPPLYEHPSGRELSFDLVIDGNLESRLGESNFAKVFPLDWNLDQPSTSGVIVSSTCFSNLQNGPGVEVSYDLRFVVQVLDNSTGKVTELNACAPIAISVPLQTDSYIPHDNFIPIISGIIDDLNHTTTGLEHLSEEWKRFRSEGIRNDRMVTGSNDHALELIKILKSLLQTLSFFLKYVHDPDLSKNVVRDYPGTNLPFNVYLLEMELLVRAMPNILPPLYTDSQSVHEPIVKSLLQKSSEFMISSQVIIMNWIQPVEGLEEALEGFEGIVEEVEKILGDIVDGCDNDVGGEKVDEDLERAIRNSVVDFGGDGVGGGEGSSRMGLGNIGFT